MARCHSLGKFDLYCPRLVHDRAALAEARRMGGGARLRSAREELADLEAVGWLVILGGYTGEKRSAMALPVQDIDSIEVVSHLSGYLRDEGEAWVAGCPALDVVTQADSQEAAKTALEEAVQMWVESCLERETLGEALRELGWHRVDRTVSAGTRAVIVPPETGAEALGEPFRLTLRIPAYRVDHLLRSEERAAG